MKNLFEILRNEGKPKTFGALDIIKNIGPGLLVTVGFIDPGNWASNLPRVHPMAMCCSGWSRSPPSCSSPCSIMWLTWAS